MGRRILGVVMELIVLLFFLVLVLAAAAAGTDSRDADPDCRVAWWPGASGATRAH